MAVPWSTHGINLVSLITEGIMLNRKSLPFLLSLTHQYALFAKENLVFESKHISSPACTELSQDLSENLILESFTAKDQHMAGTSYHLEFTLTKKSRIDGDIWNRDWRFFKIASVMDSPYEKIVSHITEPSLVQFLFSDRISQTFKVSTEIQDNIGGVARHSFSVTLLDKNSRYCILFSDLRRKVLFKSTRPDITPPLIRKLSFDKREYKAGDLVNVTVLLSETLKESGSDHIQFTNTELPITEIKRTFPDTSTIRRFKLKRIPNTTAYQFNITIPELTPPGSYRMEFFNRSDIYGNFEDSVGSRNSEEKLAADASPIVVK
jgi:hypothetical protein